MEWRDGDVTGMLPYSRLVARRATPSRRSRRRSSASPATDLRDDDSRVPRGHVDPRAHDGRSARASRRADCTTRRWCRSGKLSAGLAHELNNPAAAIERSAALLGDRLDDGRAGDPRAGCAAPTDEQLAAVDAVRCRASRRASGVRSPIEQAEREEAIADWLARHGLDAPSPSRWPKRRVTIEALDRSPAP